jgi:hypothetical protein
VLFEKVEVKIKEISRVGVTHNIGTNIRIELLLHKHFTRVNNGRHMSGSERGMGHMCVNIYKLEVVLVADCTTWLKRATDQ